MDWKLRASTSGEGVLQRWNLGKENLGSSFGVSVGVRGVCCEGYGRRTNGRGVYDDETGMGQIASTGEVRVLQLSFVSQNESQMTPTGLETRGRGVISMYTTVTTFGRSRATFRRMCEWDGLATCPAPTNQGSYSPPRAASSGGSATSTLGSYYGPKLKVNWREGQSHVRELREDVVSGGCRVYKDAHVRLHRHGLAVKKTSRTRLYAAWRLSVLELD